jgi:hypothetical protein
VPNYIKALRKEGFYLFWVYTPNMNVTAVTIVVWVIICLWIYFDAKKRNLKDPFSWSILGLLLGLVGLIGYWWWVIRPDKRGPEA